MNDIHKNIMSTKELHMNEILDELQLRFLLNLPATELSSIERLFFQLEQCYWFYEDFYADHYDYIPHLTFALFTKKIFEYSKFLSPLKSRYEELFYKFKNYQNQVPVNGCILLNKKMDKIILLCNWHGTSWTFPRGKQNENEKDWQCAIREVNEECGYDVTNKINKKNYIEIKRSLDNNNNNNNNNNTLQRSIKMFIIKDVEEDYNFKPKTRKEVSEIKWFSLNNIPKKKTYGVSIFLNKLKKFIKKAKKENNNVDSPIKIELHDQNQNKNHNKNHKIKQNQNQSQHQSKILQQNKNQNHDPNKNKDTDRIITKLLRRDNTIVTMHSNPITIPEKNLNELNSISKKRYRNSPPNNKYITSTPVPIKVDITNKRNKNKKKIMEHTTKRSPRRGHFGTEKETATCHDGLNKITFSDIYEEINDKKKDLFGVEEMFQVNEILTGQKYSYDGNPYEFGNYNDVHHSKLNHDHSITQLVAPVAALFQSIKLHEQKNKTTHSFNSLNNVSTFQQTNQHNENTTNAITKVFGKFQFDANDIMACVT